MSQCCVVCRSLWPLRTAHRRQCYPLLALLWDRASVYRYCCSECVCASSQAAEGTPLQERHKLAARTAGLPALHQLAALPCMLPLRQHRRCAPAMREEEALTPMAITSLRHHLHHHSQHHLYISRHLHSLAPN